MTGIGPSLSLVPSDPGKSEIARFLDTLSQELTGIFALVDEKHRYRDDELSTLRTIQAQRFEIMLRDMNTFHHMCTSTLGTMLHQAELLDLPKYAPGGPFTLFEWATRNHIGMTKPTFEQAYGLGKALPVLVELGVPQAIIDSSQFTSEKARVTLQLARDLGRQKKPIFERLVAERLEETGQTELSLEEEKALEEEAYQDARVAARASIIDMVENMTDDDLKRQQMRAAGVKERALFLIRNVTYRRLPGEEGVGELEGRLCVIISDEQVEALKGGKYAISCMLASSEAEDWLDPKNLGEALDEQIAEALDREAIE